jgi:hypothetical protein
LDRVTRRHNPGLPGLRNIFMRKSGKPDLRQRITLRPLIAAVANLPYMVPIARDTPSLYIPAMRAEIQDLVDEIKQSIALLRRHL